MALTVTANLTTLNGCNTTAEEQLSIGNKSELDPNVKKEGTNGIAFQTSAQDLYNGVTFNTTGQDLSNEHIRMWWQSSLGPVMKTKANGGIAFFVRDGSGNESYWYVDGSDTYSGGWRNYCIYLNYTDNPPDANNGTNAVLTNLDAAGILMDNVGSIRAIINCYIDYLRYGDGLTVKGTPSFDIEDIYQDDLSNGYGIIEKFEGVYYLSGNIIIGDSVGTDATIYDESNSVIVFTDKLVSNTLYKIEAVGNGTGDTDLTFTNCVITSAGPIFDLDFNSVDIESMDIAGCTIGGADQILLSSICTVNNSVFNACGEITPSTAEFHNNTVQNSTATNALIWVGATSDVKYCTFKGNTNAIVVNETVNQTFVGLLFGTSGDANTADVNNTGSAIEIAKTEGSNPTSQTGTTVTYTSSFNYTIKGLPNDTHTDAYTGVPGATAVRIAYNDSTNGDWSFSHSSDGVAGFINFFKEGYKFKTIELTYPANDATLPVVLEIDEWDQTQ